MRERRKDVGIGGKKRAAEPNCLFSKIPWDGRFQAMGKKKFHCEYMASGSHDTIYKKENSLLTMVINGVLLIAYGS